MSVVKMRGLLESAAKGRFAVGYFEAFNMESCQAVIDAAERANSPVIIGFSGVFLNSPKRETAENIYDWGALALSLARNTSIPVSLILNEADDIPMLVRSLHAGFNVVMYQKDGEAFEEKVEKTKYLVRTAHCLGADVESEVGELPSANVADGSIKGGRTTSPEQARHFVDETGVDALAVAVGNVHTLEGSTSRIDFDLLRNIRKKVDVPLVLHGGTGVAKEDLRSAVAMGITKVNFGTVLKRTYLGALRAFFADRDVSRVNPHELVGLGGQSDLICYARRAIADVVDDYIKVLGGEGSVRLL